MGPVNLSAFLNSLDEEVLHSDVAIGNILGRSVQALAPRQAAYKLPLLKHWPSKSNALMALHRPETTTRPRGKEP